MTLLAVPFAVGTGRSGAFYGIGVGLVLSLVYWTALSIFGALGAGGWMSPALAAWAPNILFAAAAGCLLLTVRTVRAALKWCYDVLLLNAATPLA